jgi:DNA mismatch endonuclease (patch repair protein)
MIDVVDKITRSRMMSGIRGKDTKPELDLRRALHRMGLRYRLNVTGLPGRPDIVLPRHHAAIQMHGCFWHRHEHCTFCTTPASNKRFWKSKFGETVRRDKRNLEALRKLGWRAAIVWECSIKDKGAEAVAKKIAAWLRSKRSFKEISGRNAKRVSRPIRRPVRMKPHAPRRGECQ